MGASSTLINIYVGCGIVSDASKYEVSICLTGAAKSVIGQSVASIAGASVGAYCVSADLLTEVSAFSTLIDLCNSNTLLQLWYFDI